MKIQSTGDDEFVLSQASEYEDVAPLLMQLKAKMDGIKSKAQEINAIQSFLEIPLGSTKQIDDMALAIDMRLELWIGRKEFDEEIASLQNQSLHKVDLLQMEDILSRKTKSISRMEATLPANDRLPEFRAQVEKFKKLLPVLSSLQNASLKERHWEKINATVGRSLDNEHFTVEELIGTEILRWSDCLAAISVEASQEAALEQSLLKIIQKWSETEFTLSNYKETKDMYILASIEDITTLLEDSLLTMSTIASSRYKHPTKG